MTSRLFAQTNIELSKKLLELEIEDQYVVHQIDSALIKFGKGTAQVDSAWAGYRQLNKKNNTVLKTIIKDYKKYPDNDLVGSNGSHSFWLLVQHQDADTAFQMKVLDLMKVACDSGKASIIDYAYLKDRVLVNTGQKQIYGTQCILNKAKDTYEVKPTIDIDNLDKRRKEIGLPEIAKYLEVMNNRHKVKY